MKDTWAVVSLAFILLCCIVSLLGYAITPDRTPNADLQSLEVSLAKPFSTIEFLKIPKNQTGKKQSLITTILYGKTSEYTYTPVKNFTMKGDTINADIYINYTKGNSIPQKIFFPGAENKIRSTRKIYLLGTDRFGRDVLSRMMIGTRVTMMVGFIAVLISVSIGILFGALAGYFRGWVDNLISWLMNVVWSVPTLLLVLTITISFGKGLLPVFIAVGLTMWVDVARIVRGEFLSLREREFVIAGKALGYKWPRIIFKHVLPNVMASVLVIASSNFASAILIESGLSFLGLGAQPPTPTWGNMIESNRNFIITEHAHLAFIPGFAIMLLVLAFTMVSNGLKNAMDTR